MGMEKFIGFSYEVTYANPKDRYCMGLNVPIDCRGVKSGIIGTKKSLKLILNDAAYITSLKLSCDNEEYFFENPRFKIGDVVTGNEINTYGVTNEQALLEVTEIGDGIEVKVLRHLTCPEYVDSHYDVREMFFKIATPEDIAKFK